LVALPVLVASALLTFPAAATWGSKPSGGWKVVVDIWDVLMYPGTLVAPLVGNFVMVASALIWGMIVASVGALVGKVVPKKEPRISCASCEATGFTRTGSLMTVCSACRGLGWRSPPNKSLERTREG